MIAQLCPFYMWLDVFIIEIGVGRSSTVNGLCVRSTSHVCWLRAVIYGPQETQCQIHCQDTPQVRERMPVSKPFS